MEEAVAMSQPASSPEGGAPGPERGQGPGAGKLASVKELWEKIAELQRAMSEVHDVVNTIDYDIMLERAREKLKLLEMYYELLEIEHAIKSNKVDDWKALAARVRTIKDKLRIDDNIDRIRDPLHHAVGAKAKHVLKLIDASNDKAKKVKAELNALLAEIARLEREVLDREGRA